MLSALRLAVVVACVLAGCAWRLAPVGTALLFGDEFHSLRDLANGYRFAFTHFSDTGSGMALPILVRAIGNLFGFDHWTIRAPAWFGGIATLACTYPIARRWVGATGAAVATALVATSPLLIFYSHFGRSYTLVTWLCLLLSLVVQRVVDGAPATRARCAGAALLTALLPYVHPISVGVVVPVFAGAVIALALEPARRRDARALAASGALGGIVTLLLHAPARESIVAYLRFQQMTEYHAAFGFLDVAALLVGSRSGAVVVAGVLPFALAATLARRGARGLPLVLACVGPWITVALADPFGDPYAFARYALPGVPYACIILGDFVAWLCQRAFAGARRREISALATAIALAVVLFASGPYGVRRRSDGPHANTYITMFPLPAFDVPWPGMPEFYRELARDPRPLRIIEAPALVTRSRQLYRNYYLQHGKQTSLGFAFPWEVPDAPDGPYVSFDDPDWRERSGADYLILHAAIGRELVRYWQFVYAAERELAREPSVAAYMERQRDFGGYQGPWAMVSGELRGKLRTQLGEPVYEDAEISVWRLRKQVR